MDTVAIDIDSTLAEVMPPVFEVLEPGSGLTMEEITHWDFAPERYGIDAFLEAFEEVWTNPEIEIRPTEPLIGEYVSQIRENYRVSLVTAQPDNMDIVYGKLDWLADHDVPFDRFETVPRNQSKAGLGYDVYIDDKPHLANELMDGQFQFMPEYPYNRKTVTLQNMHYKSFAALTEGLTA